MRDVNFLLNTFGSLGDLHPYIAVGLGLQARGHRVTIATSEVYRAKVLGEGLGFVPVRPDVASLVESSEAMKRAYHPRRGTEYILREVFLPRVGEMYEDLLAPAREADVLVGHPLSFALPTVAEVLGKPWVGVVLQPVAILSAWDPPSISGAPFLEMFRKWGPGFWRVWGGVARAILRIWARPVNRLRADLELKPLRNPALDDLFSPWGSQAWFSPLLAARQPDWPAGMEATGFATYDKLEPGQGMPPDLEAFLQAGEPPVVFTLGSSAVYSAGNFYEESAQAIRKMGRRAVLLVGRDAANRPSVADADIFLAEYAPFSELFHRAAAVVHQGGAGTTAQVLMAGVPSVFVPWSHDQPDNARRVTGLGVARTIPRHKYRAARSAQELEALLSSEAVKAACRRVALQIGQEDGVRSACDGLERVAMAAENQSRGG